MMRLPMRVVRGVSVALVASAAAVAFSTAASSGSSAPPGYSVKIQAVYDARGNPSLVANFSPDGGLVKARWSICPPPDVSVCATTRHVVFLTPGPSPAGTVFQAGAIYRRRTYVARTAPWLGTVHATRRPRLSGARRIGAAVTPHRARWAGGWPNSFDDVRVEACRTRNAGHCVSLSAPEYGFRRPPVIGPTLAGDYLFAFDERFARDTVFPAIGYGSPSSVPPLRVGPTVARSTRLGPVLGPRRPLTCAPRPRRYSQAIPSACSSRQTTSASRPRAAAPAGR
jgi:hypothetical protein